MAKSLSLVLSEIPPTPFGTFTPLAPKAMLSPKMSQDPPSIPYHSANGTIHNMVGTKQDLALFLHACAFSPPSLHFSPCHPTWPFQLVARSHSISRHQTPRQVPRPSTEHYRCHKCYIPSTFGICPRCAHRRLAGSQKMCPFQKSLPTTSTYARRRPPIC
jgi:hypothetical protein